MALVLLGCGSAAELTPPVTPVEITPPVLPLRIAIAGDSVLKVGAFDSLQVTLENVAGPPPTITWTIDQPGVAEFRTPNYRVGATIPLVGRSTGVATVSVAAGAATATYRVRVQDDRPVRAIQLGVEMSGTIINGVSDSRYTLDLAGNDSIDAYFTLTPSSGPVVLRETADGPSLNPGFGAGIGGLAVAQRAIAAGKYSLSVVAPYYGVGSGAVGQTSGSFRFIVRRSAPIFSVSLFQDPVVGEKWVRGGGITAPDTVWVENLGLGAMRVEVTARNARARLDRSVVTVTGPTGRDVAASGHARNGAQPILLTYDLTGVMFGAFRDTLQFVLPEGTLSVALPYLSIQKRIHDGRIDRLTRPGHSLFASGPQGEVYAGQSGLFFRVDTLTLKATLIATVPTTMKRMEVAPDGTIYVGGNTNIQGVTFPDAVMRHTAASGVFTLIDGLTASDFTVGSDGRLYCVPRGGGAIFRVNADGSRSVLSTGSATNVRYLPAENALYYVAGRTIRRYDIATGADELRFAFPASVIPDVTAFAGMDQRGTFYLRVFDGLGVFDAQGVQRSTIYPPGDVAGIGTTATRLYGADGYITWSMPLP